MSLGLIPLNEQDFWKVLNDRYATTGGVYKIIAVRNGKRVSINRFLGEDIEGVLYIGKATSFTERVIDLKKSIAPNYNGTAHICGRRYKSNPKIAKFFPYDILYIEFIQTDSPEVLERKLLTDYASIYGEVPPLNAI